MHNISLRHISFMTDEYKAWRDRIKNREKIFSALSDIPTVLCVALLKWRFFKSDAELWDSIKELLGDSIDAIRSLIELLLPNRNTRANVWRRFAHSIPQRETNMIEQILEVVNSAVKNVETHIERLDRTRAAETYSHVQNIEVTSREIKEALDGVHELMTAGNMRTQQTIRDASKHMEHFIKSELDGIKRDVQKQMMGGYDLFAHQMERMMMVENYYTSLYRVAIEEIYKRSEQSHCMLPRVPR